MKFLVDAGLVGDNIWVTAVALAETKIDTPSITHKTQLISDIVLYHTSLHSFLGQCCLSKIW